MAFVTLSKIQIQQKTPYTPPGANEPIQRNSTFTLNFVISCEVESSWATLTDTAKITIPKNITVTDQNGKKQNLGAGPGGIATGAPIIAANSTQPPLFLRGDQITIYGGLGFKVNENPQAVYQQIFQGYISGVKNKLPMEIECEDNMWLLKQVLVPNQVWPEPMENAIGQMLSLVNNQKSVNFTLAPNPQSITTNLGGLRTQDETMAQVVTRLQKDYKLECFFRSDVLYIGTIVYYPNSNPINTFILERNIFPNHNLEYTRTDDINIALKAYSVNKLELQSTTKRGATKSKNTRLEVVVSNIDGKYRALTTNKDDQSKQSNSQMRTMYFWNILTLSDLTQKAINMLHRFYYEGFRGSFTTLGLPFVQHGDQVKIQSVRLPEWNGTYFVKSLKYSLGAGGFKQSIEIDLLSSIFTPEEIGQGI